MCWKWPASSNKLHADLSPEPHVGPLETNVEVRALDVSVIGQCLLPKLSPNATLSIATEWDIRVHLEVVVYPDGACLKLLRDAQRARDVLRENSRGQAVDCVVCLLHDL